MTEPAHAALLLRGVRKSYAQRDVRVDALKGADLLVRAGEVVVLRGRSGSGKSTLLNVAGLLTRPDAGEVSIGGVRAEALDEGSAARLRQSGIGFVFQAFNLVPHLNAVENVALPVPGPARAADQRAAEALAAVGLADRVHHLPGELSGGEQQRVAVARALINNPSLVLADEPTGNLDEHSENVVLGRLRAAAGEGCAVLIVSHSDSVAALADRTLHIYSGQVTAEAPKVLG